MAKGQGCSSGQGVKLLYIRDYLYAVDVRAVGLVGGFGEVLCRLGQHEILKDLRHGLGGNTVHFDGFFHRNSDRMPFVKVSRKACGLNSRKKMKKGLSQNANSEKSIQHIAIENGAASHDSVKSF